ncbi:beta-ketoacyl-ACP synthase II [Betaproteobacteria bacterium]|nr:beta-ketoacyl-ACP synthase II [Betaproteobacteria bacterium]
MRRVVVTGLGVVSPIGNNVKSAWQAAVSGKSGIRRITKFDAGSYPVNIAGEVSDFDLGSLFSPKESRNMDTFIHFGLAAGAEAFKDSGFEICEKTQFRVGAMIGSGIGGLPLIEKTYETLSEKGPKRISPFFVPGSIINMISGHLSIKYGLKGPNLATVTACTSGLHAIGLAYRLIQTGDADAMLAGGSESTVSPLGIGGFAAARALSTRECEPEVASRPFDKLRDGFVLGEGAGVLFLESYESAVKRNARVYAEIIGFGMSGDAFHMTAPDSEGATRCMEAALTDAKINSSDIGYINAHGTSTQVGDKNETVAISQTFMTSISDLLISSTKSMTGHLLGGAGGLESVFTVLSVFNDVVPPTINLEFPDEECNLDYCANDARDKKINFALKNNFGFGGTNGSLIFKKIGVNL